MPSCRRLGDALDDRDELHEARTALVAQEAIDLAAAMLVRGVHRREDVVLDAVCAQMPQAAHDLVEAAAPTPGQTERVVDLAGAVDRDPDEELVLLEEARPLRRRAWCRSSGSCTRPAAPASGSGRPAPRSGGRTRAPSTSARRPATRPARPERGRAPRSADGRRSPAARRPSGSGCPGTASPWRGRSSRSSRGCRSRRSASRAGEKPRAHRHASRPSSDIPAAAGHRSALTATCTHRPDRIAELRGASRTAPRSIGSKPTTSGCDWRAVSASIAVWLTGPSVQASSIEAPGNQEGAIPLSPRVVAGESAPTAEPSTRGPTDHEATERHELGRSDPPACATSAEEMAVIRGGPAGHRGGHRAGHLAGRRLLPPRPPYRRPQPPARRVVHRAHAAHQHDLYLASQTPSFARSSASSAAAKAC